MTIAEQQPNPEKNKEILQYRNRLERRQHTDAHLLAAWEVSDLRWDASAPHVMPPEVVAAVGNAADASTPYENTLLGRVALLSEKAADHFKQNALLPDRQILMDSFVDATVAGILRVSTVVPEDQKALVEQAFASLGEMAIQKIQLQPDRTRPVHGSANQYQALLFSELDYAQMTEPIRLHSTDPDFMQQDEKLLSDFFHGRVEELLGTENNDGFMFVRNAFLFAKNRHGDQKRFDGTPNKTHILRLGIRLLEDEHFMADPEVLEAKLAAALLHDIVEDTPTSLEEIDKLFGNSVRDAVDTLSRYSVVTKTGRSNIEYYDNFHYAPGYVIDIKASDRVDNLEALLHLDLQSQDRDEIIFKGHEYLDETKMFYPPLLAHNPNLQNRLMHTTSVVEQYYPSPISS